MRARCSHTQTLHPTVPTAASPTSPRGVLTSVVRCALRRPDALRGPITKARATSRTPAAPCRHATGAPRGWSEAPPPPPPPSSRGATIDTAPVVFDPAGAPAAGGPPPPPPRRVEPKKPVETTISAAPQLRDKGAESRQFVPSALRVRRDTVRKAVKRSVARPGGPPKRTKAASGAPPAPPAPKPTSSKDEAYAAFMDELADLI
mmetsp:Transcript_12746/g.38164  ORF Transcript_12746/g.38164 Transcript_12746/m.38164 type:complete len:204 (+) Transcript_12746:419-1030(+)